MYCVCRPAQRVAPSTRHTVLIAELDLTQDEHLLRRSGDLGGGVYIDAWRRPWLALALLRIRGGGGAEREGEANGGVDGAAEQLVERVGWRWMRRRMRRRLARGLGRRGHAVLTSVASCCSTRVQLASRRAYHELRRR